MCYWIVFAIVTITEEISDLLLSFWLPFYYEIKIIFLFWLLSPVTRWILILVLFTFYHHLLQGLQADLQTGDPPRPAQQGGGHRPAAPTVERPELQTGSQVSHQKLQICETSNIDSGKSELHSPFLRESISIFT